MRETHAEIHPTSFQPQTDTHQFSTSDVNPQIYWGSGTFYKWTVSQTSAIESHAVM